MNCAKCNSHDTTKTWECQLWDEYHCNQCDHHYMGVNRENLMEFVAMGPDVLASPTVGATKTIGEATAPPEIDMWH